MKIETGEKLTVKKEIKDDTLTLFLNGRLDTMSASIVEKEINDIGNYKNFIMDMKDLQYLSSIGLRILLMCHKTMKGKGGKMTVVNVNESIMEVLKITGFTEIIYIE